VLELEALVGSALGLGFRAQAELVETFLHFVPVLHIAILVMKLLHSLSVVIVPPRCKRVAQIAIVRAFRRFSETVERGRRPVVGLHTLEELGTSLNR
jgi:hypothetical protein